MTRTRRKRFLAVAATAVASAGLSLSAHAQTTVGTFSGGDPGEGLDLQGVFPYAVNANSGDGPVTIQDATFVPDPGLITADNVTGFGAPVYGPSADDASLSAITDFVKWGNGTDVGITLPNLTTGGQYKLQLLFNEACCDRGFDVLIEDVNVADNFNPGTVQGNRAGGGTAGPRPRCPAGSAPRARGRVPG